MGVLRQIQRKARPELRISSRTRSALGGRGNPAHPVTRRRDKALALRDTNHGLAREARMHARTSGVLTQEEIRLQLGCSRSKARKIRRLACGRRPEAREARG